ncbi:unnamed protein product [Effrenium voratum]|nr:unnamed protein product [Effrenium voratum]
MEASVLLGFLKLLLFWLANCATVLANFAMSPVMVPLAMELTQLSCGPFFSLQIQGLACSIMGTCIMESEADAASLMALISRRIGIETFQHKVESLWRSEALQRPPKQLGDFRWYSGHFRRFLRERQRSAQRRMVQLYVSEGVGGTGLSEDVAEHYKQLIRVQEACTIFDGGVSKFEVAAVCHENIMSGPRQLFQPKACISICQAELATDRILWTPELPRKDRLIRWGPLLRSQQQHAVMCAAQHLEGLQQRNGSGHPQRLLHLRAQAEEQAQEIESLQDQLQSLSRGARESEGSGDAWRQPSMTLLEERTNQQLEEVRGLALQTEEAFSRRERDAAAQKDLADQKNLAATLQSELHSYEVELSKLGEEANNKIEAANVRIRALRREREEAAKALEERKVGNQKLTAVLQEIEDEKAQLTEQKEALIRIVEDLHSSCTQAGLQADRASIDSITGFK